ncbi:uncharacterized protein PV07_09572 [Cladophialophora immunda]|uniref:Nephrocystin 3-like N-terminal domain-containing protein n=1 Tax=Cladophialophora immunda TaxID=569365 RepID=A0A0D2CSC5_9EURO|nr:uncharacterized protein PV07_09572 [Cladophialophora immunda]KIW26479.1 hypothetical protein PV07_09572 [Cladophialophora immunda]OQV01150.1 NACHT domain-containing protein [Cladophialophora immunda]
MAPRQTSFEQYGNIDGSDIVLGNQSLHAEQINFGTGSDNSYNEMMQQFGQFNNDGFRYQVECPHGQTLGWSESHPDIKSWLSDSSSLVWIVGNPGAGKTVLAKHLLTTLEDKNKRTIYFFCDRRKKETSQVVSILTSLIHQCMLQISRLGWGHCKPEYETRGPKLLESTWGLSNIFINMMSDPGPEEWYCIIDALDDCDETETTELFKCLVEKPQASTNNHYQKPRFFITSRPCEAIRSKICKLENAKIVHFTDTDGKQLNESDIKQYIADHVRGFRHYRMDENQRMTTEGDLVEKAAGNFRWTVSMIHLLRKEAPDKYNDLVKSIPAEMKTMVAEIVARAQTQTLSLLGLVAVVQRPLSTAELAAITNLKGSPLANLISLGSTGDEVRDRIRLGEEALKIQGDRIHFFHPSLRDYLLQTWPEDKFQQLHLEVAETCLMYLTSTGESYHPFRESEKAKCAAKYKVLVDTQPFVEYAAAFWPAHVQLVGFSRLRTLWPLLFKTMHVTRCRELSFQVYKFFNHEEHIQNQSFLHILAHHNLTSVTELALSASQHGKIDLDLNARDSKRRTPLWWAVAKNRVEMVELLLNDQGVDFNARDDEGMSPVMVSAWKGFTDVTKIFLRPGFSAKVSWSDQHRCTCLYWAATSGSEDVVRLLLEQSEVVEGIANPNLGPSPLATAARKGHVQIVTALLEHGASPNAKDDDDGRAALSWAAGSGHAPVVDQLLRCRDIDLADTDRKRKWTAFQWAAAQQKAEIAGKILDAMAKRSHHDGRDLISELFLEVAAKGQDEALGIVLERHCLNPDWRDRYRSARRTALFLAAEHGHAAIVRTLVSSGWVDVNARDDKGKTALMWAADEGRTSVVQELLALEEIDIPAVDLEGRGASDWAQASNHKDIQRLIEEKQYQKVQRSRSRGSSGTA